jgi:penicillin-binding protein 2
VPHLIKGFKNKKVLIPPTFREKHYSGVDAKFYTPVIAGMDAAVASKWCGWSTPIPGIILCGKTGTSQNPHIRITLYSWHLHPKTTPKLL